MSSVPLSSLPARCFDGRVPSVLSTCSPEGVPNATWLSHVVLVDERQVALSCQFFRKTRANLGANPRAQLLLWDPASVAQWRLELCYVGSDTDGATFDAMSGRIDAIASVTRAEGVFALRSVDRFEVLEIAEVPVERPAVPAPTGATPGALGGLARLAESLAACGELDSLVESGLDFLSHHLGFENVCLYLLDEYEDSLYALSSRGYGRSGVGARVALGDGVVGACAQHRMTVRIADVSRESRYARVVKEQIDRARAESEREIAIPLLDGARSLLAVPLVLRGRLFGVVSTERVDALAFDEDDARVLTIAGQLLAQGIALYREDDDDRAEEPDASSNTPGGARLHVRYYEADDSVFLEGEYLIKGLPGRILFLLLTMREREGRSTFLNRELRLHPFLKLPSYKDNLETRLLVLQRRLDERGLALRLRREQRGRSRIECDVALVLEMIKSA